MPPRRIKATKKKIARHAELMIECPSCGNTDPAFRQDNGTPSKRPDAYLCIARVAPEDWSFAPIEPTADDIGPDGMVACGMIWPVDPESE